MDKMIKEYGFIQLMEKEHPIISAYGKTFEKQFPLILFIGREPNNEGGVVNKLGNYNFGKEGDTKEYKKRKNRCAFWNIGLKVAGFPIYSVKELKRKLKEKNGSPVLFADISCVAVPNKVKSKEKRKLREKSMEKAGEHIQNIFSHEEVMKRVKLIFLSGLEKSSVYERAVKEFEDRCKREGIKCGKIPFLYPTQWEKIWQRLKDMDYVREIKEIRKQWEASS